MEDELQTRPIKLVNFVSEEQLCQARKVRGDRVEDGTSQRDRPLYEILRENKEKKDAEFNERFKHRPPKALDEDEMDFLEKLEMSRKEFEQQIADEDANQLQQFQEAVANQASVVHMVKETPAIPKIEDSKVGVRRNQNMSSGNFIILVKPHAKKAKTEALIPLKSSSDEKLTSDIPLAGLVSYSDESEDD